MIRWLGSERGVTAVEMTIAIALIGMVSVIFVPVISNSLAATDDLADNSDIAGAGRTAIARLEREFRSADQVCEPIKGAAGHTLTFRTWLDSPDGVTGFKMVTYRLNGTDLERSQDGGPYTLVVGNVQNDALSTSTFALEGGSESNRGKVVTVNLWIDSADNARLDPILFATELHGRNIWEYDPEC